MVFVTLSGFYSKRHNVLPPQEVNVIATYFCSVGTDKRNYVTTSVVSNEKFHWEKSLLLLCRNLITIIRKLYEMGDN